MNLPVYEIERILDEAIIDGKPHYLVKWKGYSSLESTWEPIENLIDTLEIVHRWKVSNSSQLLRKENVSKDEDWTKTKRCHDQEHRRKENQIQCRLSTRQNKRSQKLNLTSEQESCSLSPQSQLDKQFQTSEFNSQEKNSVLKKMKTKGQEKDGRPENSQIERKQKQKKQRGQSGEENELAGFKVVGRVTKQVIDAVLWCFDWEDEKVCEVLLKDGRKVNMKRDDVRKICPEKLLSYYEKLERVRL